MAVEPRNIINGCGSRKGFLTQCSSTVFSLLLHRWGYSIYPSASAPPLPRLWRHQCWHEQMGLVQTSQKSARLLVQSKAQNHCHAMLCPPFPLIMGLQGVCCCWIKTTAFLPCVAPTVPLNHNLPVYLSNSEH